MWGRPPQRLPWLQAQGQHVHPSWECHMQWAGMITDERERAGLKLYFCPGNASGGQTAAGRSRWSSASLETLYKLGLGLFRAGFPEWANVFVGIKTDFILVQVIQRMNKNSWIKRESSILNICGTPVCNRKKYLSISEEVLVLRKTRHCDAGICRWLPDIAVQLQRGFEWLLGNYNVFTGR